MPSLITNKDTVSVVIPVRDSVTTIKQCLNSVFKQTLTPHEIIVVASKNDPTQKEISTYITKKKIKYIEISPNSDFIRDAHLKRWVGAKIATGKFIFFTDSKALIARNALNLSVRLAKKYQVQSVAGTAISWKEDSSLLISKLQDKALIKNNPRFPCEGFLNKLNFGHTESLPVTTALLISKKAFNSIKNDFGIEFSKEASTYDDYVISWLLVKEGYQILLTNKVVSFHKHRTEWVQYYKQISRSGQSAALMLKYYPDCPFAARRNLQVHAFAALNIFLFISLIFFIALFGVKSLIIFLLSGLLSSMTLGFINFIIEKDIYTLILFPLSYLMIANFSFHFIKWRYFVKDFNSHRVYQYFQLH